MFLGVCGGLALVTLCLIAYQTWRFFAWVSNRPAPRVPIPVALVLLCFGFAAGFAFLFEPPHTFEQQLDPARSSHSDPSVLHLLRMDQDRIMEYASHVVQQQPHSSIKLVGLG